MTKKTKHQKKRTLPNKKILNTDTQSNNNKLNIKVLLMFFLISRIVLVIFLLINKDLSIFELYDSVHYLNMAKYGYANPSLYAFFPLYPLLIKLFTLIIPSYQISGALISNLCSFLSLLILNELTKEQGNIGNIICFLFTPILAYTSIVYTESLFILLTILGYYLYKKDKYFLSAIVVGLSILTRNSGIVLWGAIGLDMLYRLFISKDKTIKFKNILIFGVISLAIGMIYPTYLYIKTGNFLEFISVQTEHWHRESGTIIDGIIKDIEILKRGASFIAIFIFLENWISFFIILIFGIKIFKKDKVASIYTIVSLIAFTTTYRDTDIWLSLSSISLFRYVFSLFPIYLYLFDNKKESTKKLICLIFILLSMFNTIHTFMGIFLG